MANQQHHHMSGICDAHKQLKPQAPFVHREDDSLCSSSRAQLAVRLTMQPSSLWSNNGMQDLCDCMQHKYGLMASCSDDAMKGMLTDLPVGRRNLGAEIQVQVQAQPAPVQMQF